MMEITDDPHWHRLTLALKAPKLYVGLKHLLVEIWYFERRIYT